MGALVLAELAKFIENKRKKNAGGQVNLPLMHMHMIRRNFKQTVSWTYITSPTLGRILKFGRKEGVVENRRALIELGRQRTRVLLPTEERTNNLIRK